MTAYEKAPAGCTQLTPDTGDVEHCSTEAEQLSTKACSRCGEVKPLTAFGQNFKRGVVVPRSECADCNKAQNREWRARTADHQRHYERVRRSKTLRQLRSAANAAVKSATESGVLVPGPCAHCDETCRGRIWAHHDDYGLPLAVDWLCTSHHQRRHVQLRRMALQHGQLGFFVADKAVAPEAKRWRRKAGGGFARRRGDA